MRKCDVLLQSHIFMRAHFKSRDAERLFSAEFSSKTSEVKQEPVEVKTEPGLGPGQGDHQQPASTMLNSYKVCNLSLLSHCAVV